MKVRHFIVTLGTVLALGIATLPTAQANNPVHSDSSSIGNTTMDSNTATHPMTKKACDCPKTGDCKAKAKHKAKEVHKQHHENQDTANQHSNNKTMKQNSSNASTTTTDTQNSGTSH